MAKLFENAYYGKPYKTKDGRKALYLYSESDNEHILFLKNENMYSVNSLGLAYYNSMSIISEWETPLSVEELNNEALKYCKENIPNISTDNINQFITCYKAGYIDGHQKSIK